MVLKNPAPPPGAGAAPVLTVPVADRTGGRRCSRRPKLPHSPGAAARPGPARGLRPAQGGRGGPRRLAGPSRNAASGCQHAYRRGRRRRKRRKKRRKRRRLPRPPPPDASSHARASRSPPPSFPLPGTAAVTRLSAANGGGERWSAWRRRAGGFEAGTAPTRRL